MIKECLQSSRTLTVSRGECNRGRNSRCLIPLVIFPLKFCYDAVMRAVSFKSLIICTRACVRQKGTESALIEAAVTREEKIVD